MPYIGKGANGFGIRERYRYSATSNQTDFTSTDLDSKTLQIDSGSLVDVYLNGILLDTADYNTNTANQVTLTSGATASDEVMIVVYDVFSLSDAMPKTGGTFSGGITGTTGTFSGDLTVDSGTLFVDASENKVGIGTTTVRNNLDFGVTSNNDHVIALRDNNTSRTILGLSNGFGVRVGSPSDGTATENMFEVGEINSSDGTTYQNTHFAVTYGGTVSFANGSTSYGNISLTNTDNLTIDCTSSGHAGITFGSAEIFPRKNQANSDDGVDLGAASIRFDDIHATNGTIQTSDQNEKQDIASATVKELNVAKKLSSLFKTFRWKSKVAEKGDNARTHTGIIAQDIQSAFNAEGLDASKYGLFISNTWWEKDKDVYNTEKEAPSDATKKTRLGVRYPELFSFIFSSIEARLTALESK